MAARRLGLGAVAGFAGVLASLVLLVGSASAMLTHPYSSSFGSGSLAFVQGVALDGSGDVYVYDAAGRVLKYNGSGTPIEFSATGSNRIEGLDFNGGGLGEVAVDNSSSSTKGDIYVATGSHVAIFAPSGESLGELNGNIESEVPATEGMWGSPCGVAVDGEGHVYVGLSSGHVFKYAPGGNPVVNTDYSSSLNGLESVCSLAVDSTGSVYAAAWFGGPVHKYDSLQFGALQAEGTLVSEQANAVAVDAANDDVYVDQGSQVVQYSSAGEQLAVSNGGLEKFGNSYAVAVNAGTVYVSDQERGRIDILGPAAIVPDVTIGEASVITTTSERLTGAVNPDGVPGTGCRFEYTVSGFLVPENWQSVLCTANPGAGSEPVEVNATVTGLAPNTNYRFKLIAENANGKVGSESAEFKTVSTPLVRRESPREVSYESASIEAQIAPMAESATYRVEYGPDTSYGMRVAASTDATVGGTGSEYVTVKQTLTGLQPGATYHFRLVATNQYGTTYGADWPLNVPSKPSAVTDSCPNAAIRQVQQASSLPECRAYEMVSPVEKDGGNIAAQPSRTQAALDGESIKFFSKTAFGDVIGSEMPGAEYIADRGPNGWATHSINPEQGGTFAGTIAPSSYIGISPDLTKGVFLAHTPVLAAHSNVARVTNLYLRQDLQSPGPGNYELLSDSIAPLEPRGVDIKPPSVQLDWTSADWHHIIFESFSDLTADTAGMDSTLPKLYEWHDGTVEFVGVLPDSACENPPCLASESIGGSGGGIGAPLGSSGMTIREYWTQNAISADGSRIVFEAGPLEFVVDSLSNARKTFGDLYMRIEKSRTVQLNASERSTPDPEGHRPARFLAATADDSKVFFESPEMLTDDASPIIGQPETGYLYMYQVNAPAGKRLSLIATAVDGAPIPAINKDGTFVYFFGGTIAGLPSPGDGMNLYVWHDGEIRYIAFHKKASTTGPEGIEPGPRWGESGVNAEEDEFRMSTEGKKILFASPEPSVAQHAGVSGSSLHRLMFVYDYDTDKMTCVSCSPSGEVPASDASFERPEDAAFESGTQYSSRAMSPDGRYVFFNTGDPLVAQDVNGRRDVYEYDTTTHEVHLLSDGSCSCDATFVDATPNASNVFFTTQQQLVRIDKDSLSDLYDVRADGGIAAQNEPSPPGCDGEECRGPATGAPVLSTPSSATFSGQGNPKTATPKSERKRRRPTLAQALRACKRRHTRKQRNRCRARVRRAYHVNRAAAVKASRRAGR